MDGTDQSDVLHYAGVIKRRRNPVCEVKISLYGGGMHGGGHLPSSAGPQENPVIGGNIMDRSRNPWISGRQSSRNFKIIGRHLCNPRIRGGPVRIKTQLIIGTGSLAPPDQIIQIADFRGCQSYRRKGVYDFFEPI